MEVILKKYIKGLGRNNDIVTVKPGYARNFLIPRGKAIMASETNKKILAENQRQTTHKAEKLKKDAESIIQRLKNLSIDIGAKVGENDRIFGSVTPAQISEKLAEQGFEIDRKKIIMQDNPKFLGNYTVTLNLHQDIQHSLNVNVVPE